jgi:DNA-binding NarL/FixJ family response regulator
MLWTTRIVLLVAREDGVLEILRTALQPIDYVLVHAKTRDDALTVISRLNSPIDVAILDLDLPNDNGRVISLLAVLGGQKTTKIIVKTSRQDEPFLEQVNCLGVDAVVLKPISEDQLIKTIQETLSGRWNRPAVASAGS